MGLLASDTAPVFHMGISQNAPDEQEASRGDAGDHGKDLARHHVIQYDRHENYHCWEEDGIGGHLMFR